MLYEVITTGVHSYEDLDFSSMLSKDKKLKSKFVKDTYKNGVLVKKEYVREDKSKTVIEYDGSAAKNMKSIIEYRPDGTAKSSKRYPVV